MTTNLNPQPKTLNSGKSRTINIPMIEKAIEWAEHGKIPDPVMRFGIRRLCKQRLQDELAQDAEQQQRRFQSFIEELRDSPIAIETQAANEQHYEVPTDFYKYSLGQNLKYSSCYYPTGITTLDQAEAAMLSLYMQRADLNNGQKILELGCGWGSLTLWIARALPDSQITGVSNSSTQRQHIEKRCEELGLSNVTIITADINELELEENQFDRAISIEMFEHMRNYQQLMTKISRWLKTDAKLFVHIFAHRYLMYPYEVKSQDDWMSKYFFSGGIMPSVDTLLHFQDQLKLQTRWLVDGRHYERTSNHWLKNMDNNKPAIMNLFSKTYGNEAAMWFNRWRIFYMSCAELFGYNNGQEWMVAHYLFRNSR